MIFLITLFGKKSPSKTDEEELPVPSVEELRALAFRLDFNSLSRLLKHKNPEARSLVVKWIGMAGQMRIEGDSFMYDQTAKTNPQAVTLLMKALNDEDPKVSEAAAEALEDTRERNDGPKSPEVEKALAGYCAHKKT